MDKQITIRIYPDGIVESVVLGIKGKKCTDYIKVIEGILDANVFDSDYTPEYYETVSTTVDQEEIFEVSEGI